MDCPQCNEFESLLWELESELAGAKVRAQSLSNSCPAQKDKELGAALFLTHQIEKTRQYYADHRRTHRFIRNGVIVVGRIPDRL